MSVFPEGFKEHLSPLHHLNFDAFSDVHGTKAPISVRLHPLKGKNLFQELPKVPWADAGRYLASRPDFTLDPKFHAGAYYVQEAASMSLETVLEQLVNTENEPCILDLCAAPGGKSTLIASFLNGKGTLLCNEVIKTRAGILKENLDRWGYANVLVSNNDPKQFSRLNSRFDVIVIDAPCSGSGMFRKDPSTMSHWSEEAVEHCVMRQIRIVNDVWPALKPDGILIYSTCSYSFQEDEGIIESLISDGKAELVAVDKLSAEDSIIKTELGYRFYPHLSKSEGLFISVVRKTKGDLENLHPPIKSRLLQIDIASLIAQPSSFSQHKNHLGENLVSNDLLNHLYAFEKHLHLLKTGVLSGELKGNKFIPNHELAMFTGLNPEIQSIELDLETALRFLKKEALPNNYGLTGLTLIKYLGLPIGWGNALPNRINNGLPKSWRIRKELPSEV
ncbi:MAG: hypothetical protein WED33_03815 [Bacteroidia bacterium]